MRPAVQCVLRQEEIIVQDSNLPALQGRAAAAFVYLPLIVEGGCIGAFSVQSFKSNAYSPKDLMALRTMQPYIAAALNNADAYQQLMTTLDELRRTQSQLVQAEKMAALGTLVAGVAHELNTPIGVAVTAASTLEVWTQDFVKRYKEGGLKKSEMEAYIQTAETGANLTLRNLERAANLIQSFKQVAVDQTHDEMRRFKVGAYIHEIITSLQPMLKTTQHRVELVATNDIEVLNFPGALSQIITNFIQNSLKHAFEGFRTDGFITIVVAKANDMDVAITYSDDGAGIPDDVLPRIFDPFFTTKPGEQGGTGLGLHIAYNLATQKMGGTLRVESKEGVGTTFFMTMPIEFTPEEAEGNE
jgi:signal transduction histidine kinase